MTRARVAYQGEPGAFAEEAARTFFAAANVAPVPTWRGVFEAVRDGVADAGAVPIENSLVGTIRENHDLLYEFHDDGIRIHGEVSVPVRLALLALPDQRIDADRAGVLAPAGARAGRCVPAHAVVAGDDDLQHRRRRQAHRGGRGAWRRRDRRAAGRRDVRADHPRRRGADRPG